MLKELISGNCEGIYSLYTRNLEAVISISRGNFFISGLIISKPLGEKMLHFLKKLRIIRCIKILFYILIISFKKLDFFCGISLYCKILLFFARK